MKKRPKKIVFVSWFAIIAGALSILGSGGYLFAIYHNQGGIHIASETRPIIQLLCSILAIVGGIGLLKKKPISRGLLSVIFFLAFVAATWTIFLNPALSMLNNKETLWYLFNQLILIIPFVACFVILQKREVIKYLAQK